VLFLTTIAVVSTIPWDSYLIRQGIWTYPPRVIIGPTLLSIPAEEVFFFIVQTYTTSLLFLLLNKPTLNPCYLVPGTGDSKLRLERLRTYRTGGQGLLFLATIQGAIWVHSGREETYLGLILIWACPFLLLLWTLAYQFLIGLPYTSTIVPIALPTLYLWIVDTLALRRGTWTIQSGTKIGWCLWEGLEIEEAAFFLITNMLIVFGMVAFENALAVVEAFPKLYPDLSAWPSPLLLVKALLLDPDLYDEERLAGISEGVIRLSRKSRSFYLASSVFPGRLRVDLILL
jgi:15-cis-phytoene synthase/lycopene beta-cyclase